MSKLSMAAQFDDLLRLSTLLVVGQEDEFYKFVEQEVEHRKSFKVKNNDLEAEVKKLQTQKWELETKLKHAQCLIKTSNTKIMALTAEKNSLAKQLVIIKDVLMSDQNTLNEETKGKLAFLEEHDKTVDESVGLHLSSSEYSLDQTDEDIDNGIDNQQNRRRSRKSRGRKSGGKRRSSQRQKSGKQSLSFGAEPPQAKDSSKDDDTDSDAHQRSSLCIQPKRYRSDSALPISTETSLAQRSDFVYESEAFSPFNESKLTEISMLERTRLSLGAKERKHYFVTKTIIRPETCTHCKHKIKFSRPAIKCQDCRITCHPECRANITSGCSRTVETPVRRGSKLSLTDFTYHTSPMIPELILQCTKVIESVGLNEPGLYRISGSEKIVRELRNKLLGGKGPQCLNTVDIHAVCSVVKDFFRSLHEPLVTRALWKEFEKALAETNNRDQRVQLACGIIDKLPQPNKDTLAFMVLHLHRVAASPHCKMPTNNLAKVFGPTIIGYSTEEPTDSDALLETGYQFMVMELFLTLPLDYWNNILQEDSENDDTVFSLSTPDYKAPAFRRETSLLGSLTSKGRSAKRAIAVHLGRTSLTPRTCSATSAKKTKKFFESPMCN